MWWGIALLTVDVYSGSHRVLYIIEISMTRLQKSASASIYNANKNAYSFISNIRIIICISCKRAWHPLQENRMIFSKKNFNNFKPSCRKNLASCLLLLLVVEWYLAYQLKGIDILHKKIQFVFLTFRIFYTKLLEDIECLLTLPSLLIVKWQLAEQLKVLSILHILIWYLQIFGFKTFKPNADFFFFFDNYAKIFLTVKY